MNTFEAYLRDNEEQTRRDLKARRQRRRGRDPRLEAYEAARKARAIVVTEEGTCICAQCVATIPLEGDDLETVGVVRIATTEDIQRAPRCMGCNADMSAPPNRPALDSGGA